MTNKPSEGIEWAIKQFSYLPGAVGAKTKTKAGDILVAALRAAQADITALKEKLQIAEQEHEQVCKLLDRSSWGGYTKRLEDDITGLKSQVEALKAETVRLQAWVNDLQSGKFINCVYCGHQYGPDPGTPASMADVLKRHIEICTEHPMSKLRSERDSLLAAMGEKDKFIGGIIKETWRVADTDEDQIQLNRIHSHAQAALSTTPQDALARLIERIKAEG